MKKLGVIGLISFLCLTLMSCQKETPKDIIDRAYATMKQDKTKDLSEDFVSKLSDEDLAYAVFQHPQVLVYLTVNNLTETHSNSLAMKTTVLKELLKRENPLEVLLQYEKIIPSIQNFDKETFHVFKSLGWYREFISQSQPEIIIKYREFIDRYSK